MAAKKKSKGRAAKPAARRPKKAATRRAARAKAKSRPAARGTARAKSKARPKRNARPARSTARPPVPNACGLVTFHTDYATHNLAEVKRFYTEQLGFTSFRHDSKFDYLWVQTTHGSSLGFMPPMAGMGESTPPREPTLYLMVEDVDAAYSRLTAKGVVFSGPPADMPWGHRVLATKDPEGRNVMLAQDKTGRS